jgi:hypothetical protein
VKHFWRRFLAQFRLSPVAICEESRGAKDFHDYGDCICGRPWHWVEHVCSRCGKVFTI